MCHEAEYSVAHTLVGSGIQDVPMPVVIHLTRNRKSAVLTEGEQRILLLQRRLGLFRCEFRLDPGLTHLGMSQRDHGREVLCSKLRQNHLALLREGSFSKDRVHLDYL